MSIIPIRSRSIETTESNVITLKRKDLSFKSLTHQSSASPQYLDANIYRAQALFSLPKTRISFQGNLPQGLFKEVAATEAHPLWKQLIARIEPLYQRPNDVRSEFDRDSDRIFSSRGYSKLMAKAQVIINAKFDTTSTRMWHVDQVVRLSEQLAKHMGLNVELTRAIATGHDIGHGPFGHSGERALADIKMRNNISGDVWHAKNGVRVVDSIETIPDINGIQKNLDLTYAVRDGIICHSASMTYHVDGLAKTSGLKPRTELINLESIDKYTGMHPITWEGCVVKMADDIAQLGRDIEDAISNGVLENADEKKRALILQIKQATGEEFADITQGNLVTRLKLDLLEHSNPLDGLKFSENGQKVIDLVEKFIHENIHSHDKKQNPYIKHVLNTIFDDLNSLYCGAGTYDKVEAVSKNRPQLMRPFHSWLGKYSNAADSEYRAQKKYGNKILYDINNPDDYKKAVIEYMTAMTDRGAIEAYNEAVFR